MQHPVYFLCDFVCRKYAGVRDHDFTAHARLGAYQSAANASLVAANGDSAAVMAAELKMAKQFGVGFWAYCTYPIGCKDYAPAEPGPCDGGMQCCADNYALSYALERHLASPDRALVNASLILQGPTGTGGNGGWWPASAHGGNETTAQEVARYVALFQQPHYHKVDGGRPLVFLLSGATDKVSVAATRLLQAEVKKAMGAEVFLVYMGDSKGAAAIGADAVSRYMVAENKLNGASFEDGIAAPERAFWASAPAVLLGFGRIVTLYYRSSTSYQTH
jgi:hypothetical protein